MSSSRESNRSGQRLLPVIAKSDLLVAGVLLAIIALLAVARSTHYLFFHTMAELFAIVVSLSIFVLTWISSRYFVNGYLVVLGGSYGAVALVDIFHTLTFRGMDLFPGVSTNYPTQFWLTARFLEALAVLGAPLFVTRKPNFHVVSLAFVGVAAVACMAVMAQWFPATFVDGLGLTTFKIYSEYLIIAMLLAGFVMLHRAKDRFEPRTFFLLVSSLWLAVATEFCFTRYGSFYDFTNELGHYFRFLSVALAFIAIVLSGVRQPFELIFREVAERKRELDALNTRLQVSEDRLNQAQAVAKVGSWHFDANTHEVIWSLETYRIFGVPVGAPQSLDTVVSSIHPEDQDAVLAAWSQAQQGAPYDIEHRVTVDGQVRWVRERAQFQFGTDGAMLAALGTVQDITESRHTQALLRDSEAFNASVFDSIIESAAVLDAQGTILAVNKPWRQFALGNGSPQLAEHSVGLNYLDICAQSDARAGGEDADIAHAVAAGIRAVLNGAQTTFEIEYPCHSPDEQRWFHLSVSPLQGSRPGAVVAHQNVTERKRIEAALRESEARMSAVFQASPIGIVISRVDNGHILEVNDACLRLYNYTRDEVLGHTVVELSAYAHPEQRAKLLLLLREHGRVDGFLIDFRTHDGKVGVLEMSGRLIELQGESCMLAMLNDVTERQRAHALIHEQALHDALTHLPNRRLLGNRLKQAMSAAKRSGCYGALMFLDLDNFKPLNDTQGHEVGDLLLIEAAARLKKCVREVDTVARVGGDEFVVMLSALDSDRDQSRKQASAVAEKIRDALSRPYVLTLTGDGRPDGTVEHHCTASVGVALFVNDEVSHNDMLNRADVAMYQAKQAGRNAVRFHDTKI